MAYSRNSRQSGGKLLERSWEAKGYYWRQPRTTRGLSEKLSDQIWIFKKQKATKKPLEQQYGEMTEKERLYVGGKLESGGSKDQG